MHTFVAMSGGIDSTALAQSLLFSLDEIYAAATDSGDKGQACGLFCHR